MIRSFFLIVIVFSFYTGLVGQDTVAGWTFPDEAVQVSSLANLGTESNSNALLRIMSDGNPATGGLFMQPNPGSTVEDYHAAAKGWDGGSEERYWFIEFNGAGYMQFKISSRQRSDPGGPRDFRLQYKFADQSGAEWADVQDGMITCSAAWQSGTVQGLSLTGSLNDPSDLIHIRWLMDTDTSVAGGLVDSLAISYIDDIIITGEKIPGIGEPFSQTRFLIFPNPASGYVTVRSGIEIEELRIMDLTGRVLQTIKRPEIPLIIDVAGSGQSLLFLEARLKGSQFPVKEKLVILDR